MSLKMKTVVCAALVAMLLLVVPCAASADGDVPPPADAGPRGDAAGYMAALRQRESGGHYEVMNQYGYVGAYQMGETALVEAGWYQRAPGASGNHWGGGWTGTAAAYGVTDLESFRQSPAAQDAAQQALMQRQWTYIERYHLDQYIGQEINGVRVTESGLLAAVHLGGIGTADQPGIRQWLESHGEVNGSDANGTTVESYLQRFGGYDVSRVTGQPPSAATLAGHAPPSSSSSRQVCP